MSQPVSRAALAVGALAAASPGWAAELQVKLEVPRLDVAEYHRPYVAVWLEKAGDPGFAGHLAVWYDQKKPNHGGTKWVNDLRQWWRKGGRELKLPVDGVSGATRAPGQHVLQLGQSAALAGLAPGAYEVVVEAAREAGGREVLRLPLQWPPKGGQQTTVRGEHELGEVSLVVKP
jgi:hypothetical protein